MMVRPALVGLVGVVLGSVGLLACQADGPLVEPRTPVAVDPSTCGTRKGGAMIQIEVNGSNMTLWSTNPSFIAGAKELQASKRAKTAMFDEVNDGRDCDPQWTFHVDSAHMSWAQVTMEGCDGRPMDVERDKASWMKNVKRYCPWSARVVSVEERS